MAHEAVQTQQLHGFSQADYDRTRLEIRRLLTNQHSANASPSSSSSSPVAPALSAASSSSSPSTSTSKAPAPTAPTSAPGPVPLPAAQQQKHQQDPFGRDIRLQIPPPPTPFHQQTQTESQSSPARAKGSLDRFLSGDKPQVSSLSSPPRHPVHQQHNDVSFNESTASTPKAGGPAAHHMIMDPNAGGVAPSPSLRQSVKRKADHLEERPQINLNHTLIQQQQQQQQAVQTAARQSQEQLQASPTDARGPAYHPQQAPQAQPPKLHFPTHVTGLPPQPNDLQHQRKLEEHNETDESVEDNASSQMAPSTQSSSNGTQPDAAAQSGGPPGDMGGTPVRPGKPPNAGTGGSRSKGGRRAAQEGAFKRDRNAKPPYSYAALIGQAITATQNNRISLADIYNYIQDNYPFYKKEEAGWQNSIRHNLSLNECFVKTPRTDIDAPGKGSLWCIAPGKEDQFVNGNFVKKGHHKKGRSKKSGAPGGEAGSTAGASSKKSSAKGKDDVDEELEEDEEDGDEDGDRSHSNEMLADAAGVSSQERPPSQTSTASGSTSAAAPAQPTLVETGPSSDAVAEHQPAAATKTKASAKGQSKQTQPAASSAGRGAAARPSKRAKTGKFSVAATRAPQPPAAAAAAAPSTDDLDDLDEDEDEDDDGQETEVERRSAKEEWVLDEDEDQELPPAAPSAPPQSVRGHHRRRSSMLGGSQMPYEEPVKRPNRGLSASTGAAPGYPHAPLLGAPAELLPPLSTQTHGQSRHLRGSSGSSAADLLASPPNRLGASSSFPFMPPASIGQAYRSPEIPSSSSVFGATSSPYIGSSAQNYTQSPVSSMRSSKFQSSSPRQNEVDNLNVDTSPLASFTARPRAGSSPPSTRTQTTQDNPERAPAAVVSRTAEDIRTPPPPTLLSSPRRSLLDGAAAPNNNSTSRALQLLQSAGSSWPSNGYQGFGLSPVDHKVLSGRSTTPTPSGVETSGEQRPTASPQPLFSSPGAFNFGGLGNATWSPF